MESFISICRMYSIFKDMTNTTAVVKYDNINEKEDFFVDVI